MLMSVEATDSTGSTAIDGSALSAVADDSTLSAVADDAPPPFRYGAALADTIETSWQARWEREHTFDAPNPVGELSTGFDRMAIRRQAVGLDTLPYPSGAGLPVVH